jgi:hypothetical protein
MGESMRGEAKYRHLRGISARIIHRQGDTDEDVNQNILTDQGYGTISAEAGAETVASIPFSTCSIFLR